MPSISNETIRELYELYGNDDYPVEQYCIGCGNCENYGFPCMNCATYVFGGRLGAPAWVAAPMDIDDDDDDDIIPGIQDIPEIVNDNDMPETPPTIDDHIPNNIDSSDDDESAPPPVGGEIW